MISTLSRDATLLVLAVAWQYRTGQNSTSGRLLKPLPAGLGSAQTFTQRGAYNFASQQPSLGCSV